MLFEEFIELLGKVDSKRTDTEMYVLIDGASEVGDIDIDFVVDGQHLFLEGDFNIPAFFVASLDNLAQLLVK